MRPSSEGSSLPRPTAPLGDDELREAIELALAGDPNARQRIIQSHLRLVWDIVRRFRHRGEDPDDLFQLGCLGLVKALDRFDPGYGTKFTTYAVPLIIGEIRRHLRDDGSVRVSRGVKELAYRAWRTEEDLTKATGQVPTAAEIARVLGVEPAEVVESMEAAKAPLSLFRETSEEGEGSLYLIDQLTARGAVAASAPGKEAGDGLGEATHLDSIALREGLSRLDERMRQLVMMRFFEDMTQAEVGEVLGVSQVQISRLEKKALLSLREMLGPG
jgi:RNA polymerase sporulation-specific sigma factor